MKAIQDYTAGTHTYGYGITGSHLNNAQERIFVTRGHHLVTKPPELPASPHALCMTPDL